MGDRQLLDEQIAYYRARAGEYDATSAPDDDPFAARGQVVRDALAEFGARGRVLELAAGTGQWTAQLAASADELLVTDSSPEMLDLNRAKTGPRPHVRYEIADALRLQPTHAWDVVFFGFFLSHVPLSSFDEFWQGVAGALAPGGRVFFVDEAAHGLWEEDWVDRQAGIVNRPLTDGTIHRAIKVLHDPDDLTGRLARLGWTTSVQLETPFYWGTAHR